MRTRSEQIGGLDRHWTLDESNPKRVPIREYARAVGRNGRVIGGYAHGYALWKGAAGGGSTLGECIERAKMGGEKEAVTEAVAKARNVSFGEARKKRVSEGWRPGTRSRCRGARTGSVTPRRAWKRRQR